MSRLFRALVATPPVNTALLQAVLSLCEPLVTALTDALPMSVALELAVKMLPDLESEVATLALLTMAAELLLMASDIEQSLEQLHRTAPVLLLKPLPGGRTAEVELVELVERR